MTSANDARSFEECLLVYRRRLRQLLHSVGVLSNPAVDDDWVLNQIDDTVAQHRQALRGLYSRACHHPHCVRGDTPHQCSCGVSAALEEARRVLGSRMNEPRPVTPG